MKANFKAGFLFALVRGHIYVADEQRVRMITPDGTVTTIAGGAAEIQMERAPMQDLIT